MMKYLVLAFSTYCLIGCTGGDKSEYTSISSDCPPKKEVKKVNPNINNYNFFLDVSGSMADFMPEANQIHTDFQILLPNLITELSGASESASFFCISGSKKNLEKRDIKSVGTLFEYGKFKKGLNTELPVMFDSAISKLTPSSISILITDGIYSPDSIKKRGQVVTDVSGVIKKAKNKGFSTSCYALKSQFKNNTSIYYLFVFGEPQNLQVVKNQLKTSLINESSAIQNHEFQEIYFGIPEITPFYSILQFTENPGTYEPRVCEDWDNRCLVLDNVEVTDDSKFWVGFNLKDLPGYATDKAYLKNNLVILQNGIKVDIGQILTQSEFASKISQDDKSIFDKSSHFVQFKISDLADKNAEITISLKKTPPDWIGKYSNSDAENAEKIRQTTYGLDNIITGISSAYQDKESLFFFQNLKLVFSKK